MSKKQTGVALLLILLLSLTLRISYNFDRSMRFDEAFSMLMVTEFSWSDMIDRIARDVHPPLYYVLLRLWVNFWGENELISRFMSILFGMLTVFAIYLFARDCFWSQPSSKEKARTTGIIAALLVTVTSFQIHWSQEIRMYSLGTMLAVFSSWFLIRAVQSESNKWWFWYIFTSAAFLLTHNYALFTVASQGLFCILILWKDQQNRHAINKIHPSIKMALSYLAISLIYAPWISVLWKQYHQVKQGYWLSDISVWTVSDSIYSLFIPSIPCHLPSHFESACVASLMILLIVYLFKKDNIGMLLTACLIAGPIVLSIALSIAATPIIYHRYFIFIQLFIICGISLFLTSFKNKLVISFLTLVTTVNLLFLHFIFIDSCSNATRLGTRGAAKYIRENIKKNDRVIVVDSYIFPAIKYYTKSLTRSDLHVVKSQLKHFSGAPVLTENDFAELSSKNRADPENIWVIGLSRNVNLDISQFAGGNQQFHLTQQIAFTQNWSNQTREVIVTQYHQEKE